MEFNTKIVEAKTKAIVQDFPVLGVKSTDDLDKILEAISKKFQEISASISAVDSYQDSFDTAISSNKFGIKLTPSSSDVKLEYNLEDVGKGRFMRAKFGVFSTNEYGTEYSVFESTYLKNSVNLSPYLFPLTVYIQYREVLDQKEIEFTKSLQITGVNETIEDRLHYFSSPGDSTIALKDKLKTMDSNITFLLNRAF